MVFVELKLMGGGGMIITLDFCDNIIVKWNPGPDGLAIPTMWQGVHKIYSNRKLKPEVEYGIDLDLTPALGPGVLILSHNGHVIYVGKARCLIVAIYMYRTVNNATNLPNWFPVKRMIFDSVRIIPCDTTRAGELARGLIELHNPLHNRKPKLTGQGEPNPAFTLPTSQSTQTIRRI